MAQRGNRKNSEPRSGASRGDGSTLKDWWRAFFCPVVGQIMFQPKADQTEIEVAQVIKQSKVKAPLKVLDLACGTGRHSLVFAARGFAVTGLDYSEPYLREARAAARKSRTKVRFIHGDMKKLRPHFAAGEFGLVVSLYNSFGYFGSRRDDLKMLRDVHRVLQPGGALVLNTLNEGGVIERLRTPLSTGREPLPNLFMIDAARYDADTKQAISNWTIIDARGKRTDILRLPFRQNVYSHDELKRLLAAAGFKAERTWGLLPGGPFDKKKSWYQTIVARKQA